MIQLCQLIAVQKTHVTPHVKLGDFSGRVSDDGELEVDVGQLVDAAECCQQARKSMETLDSLRNPSLMRVEVVTAEANDLDAALLPLIS